MRLCTLALLALLPLGACSTVQEAVAGPDLTPVRYPAALVGQQQQVILASANQPLPSAASANSLWRTGARAFFLDQRANRVGDIVTVLVNINDNANLKNVTSANRSSAETGGMPNFFGMEALLPKNIVDPSKLLSVSSANNNVGNGQIQRTEAVTLRLAGVVTQVLPNGNLVVAARQEFRVNHELRELQVTGVIRPQDIASNNTVLHDRMAEARIAYGGRGQLTEVQSPRWGQQLMDILMPF